VIGTTSTTAAGTGWRSRCAYGSGMADEESGRLERAIGGGVDLLGKLAGESMGLVSPDAALAGPPVELVTSQVLRRIGDTVVNMVGQGAAERTGAALDRDPLAAPDVVCEVLV
jgi:hypothetical protein